MQFEWLSMSKRMLVKTTVRRTCHAWYVPLPESGSSMHSEAHVHSRRTYAKHVLDSVNDTLHWSTYIGNQKENLSDLPSRFNNWMNPTTALRLVIKICSPPSGQSYVMPSLCYSLSRSLSQRWSTWYPPFCSIIKDSSPSVRQNEEFYWRSAGMSVDFDPSAEGAESIKHQSSIVDMYGVEALESPLVTCPAYTLKSSPNYNPNLC